MDLPENQGTMQQTYHEQNSPEEGVTYASEYDFHSLHGQNPGASFILQGYCRMLGCESYSYMHTYLTIERMKAFVAAFGRTPKGGTVPELWADIMDIFGIKPEKAPAKAAEKEKEEAK